MDKFTNQSQQGGTTYTQQAAGNYAQQAAPKKSNLQSNQLKQKLQSNQQNLKQNQLKQTQLRPQTQEKSDQSTDILQKIKHNFTLILVNFGFLLIILVANILVFLRIFSDIKTIKLDLLEIQSRGEALQKKLKPLEAAISSLGIGDTTPSPTTPPITGNTYNPAQ